MSFFQSLLTAKRSNLDLFLVIGDSTGGSGTNGNTGAGPTPTANTAFYYRRSNTSIATIGANDLEFASDPPNNGSQWPKFCIDYNTSTGRNAVIIPCSVPGASFYPKGDTNNWSPSGVLYAAMQTDVTNCMIAANVFSLTGIFVFCGYNDAANTEALADITGAIEDLFDLLETEFPGVPIIVNQVGTSPTSPTTARIAAVRRDLKNQAVNRSGSYLLWPYLPAHAEGYYTDSIHLNQTGQNMIGEVFARWCANTSLSKWGRSIVSSMFSEINANRKTLIDGVSGVLTHYLNHEAMYLFRATQESNYPNDWTGLCVYNKNLGGGAGVFTFTTSDNVTANGINDAARPGFVPSLSSFLSSQNDIFFAVKTDEITTAAGTFGTLYGGLNSTSTIGVTILQISPTGLRYRVNDVTNRDYTSDAKLANNVEYCIRRNGGTKSLLKDGTQVDSVAVASTGVMNASINLMCNNNEPTAVQNSFLAGSILWYRAGKEVGMDHPAMNTWLQNIIDHWND